MYERAELQIVRLQLIGHPHIERTAILATTHPSASVNDTGPQRTNLRRITAPSVPSYPWPTLCCSEPPALRAAGFS